MAKLLRDPRDASVQEGVLTRIRAMSSEDWDRELAWRPEGLEDPSLSDGSLKPTRVSDLRLSEDDQVSAFAGADPRSSVPSTR